VVDARLLEPDRGVVVGAAQQLDAVAGVVQLQPPGGEVEARSGRVEADYPAGPGVNREAVRPLPGPQP
jgi:hypothetical protein